MVDIGADLQRVYDMGFKDGAESERPRAFGDGYEVGYDNALKLVRCKDCKHYNSETHGCKRNPSVEGWLKDDFCSYAEKQVASKLEIVDTPTDSPTNTPTEDCISRQEAIDMVSKYHRAFVYDSDVDELIVELESLPPVEPKRPKGELKDKIMDIYDVRPSTAEHIQNIVEAIVMIAENEYTRGYAEVTEDAIRKAPNRKGGKE